MKTQIILGLLVLLSINQVFCAQQQSENPTLVFFVKHQNSAKNDYVEISLKIQSKDSSLTKAIKGGASNVEDISTLAKEFCEEYAKKKNECKEIVDAGQFEIEPRYQLIRKSPVFMGFTVTHEMTIAVKSVQKIGHLVDKVLAKEGITLEGFEWKSSIEPRSHEEAIAEGMEEGEGLCSQLGLKLGRILSVEEVPASELETSQPAEGQEEQQEEDSDEADLTVFKFEVQCGQKQKTKKE